MRKGLARLFTIVAALSVAACAGAYYDDTHYSFTYFIARACGYTPLQAYRIASACVSVDHCDATEPDQYLKVFNQSYAANSAQQPRVDFHAFMNNIRYPDCLTNRQQAEEAMTDILNRRDVLYQKALANGNPGVLLHFLQDETSHFGYSSWGGHWASWGAYKNNRPLGPTVDYLAYAAPERHYEMINRTIDYLTQFMKATSSAQHLRSPNRGREVIPLLTALRDANPAPPPMSGADALKLGLVIAGRPVLSAIPVIRRISELKSGPDMEKADAAVERALKAWGEFPAWNGGVFPRQEFPYRYDASGEPVPGQENDWTLYGKLKVNLYSAEGEGDVEVTVKGAPTRAGEQEVGYERKPAHAGAFSTVVEFPNLPVGDYTIEVKAGHGHQLNVPITLNALEVEKRVRLDEGSPYQRHIDVASATVSPPSGRAGTSSKLTIQYKIAGVDPAHPVSLTEAVNAEGPVPVEFHRIRTVPNASTRFAEFEANLDPGDYVWNYQLSAPGYGSVGGVVRYRVARDDGAHKIIIVSASITPKNARVGDLATLHLAYRVAGAGPSALATLAESVAVTGSTSFAFPQRDRSVPSEATYVADFSLTPKKPGDSTWTFSLSAPGFASSGGSALLHTRGRSPQLVVLSAVVSPTKAKLKQKVKLRVTYRIDGVEGDSKVSMSPKVSITGPVSLPLRAQSKTSEATTGNVTLEYVGMFAVSGRYLWHYALACPDSDAATGTVPFTVGPAKPAKPAVRGHAPTIWKLTKVFVFPSKLLEDEARGAGGFDPIGGLSGGTRLPTMNMKLTETTFHAESVNRPRQSLFAVDMNWDAPPSSLAPGQVVKLTIRGSSRETSHSDYGGFLHFEADYLAGGSIRYPAGSQRSIELDLYSTTLSTARPGQKYPAAQFGFSSQNNEARLRRIDTSGYRYVTLPGFKSKDGRKFNVAAIHLDLHGNGEVIWIYEPV